MEGRAIVADGTPFEWHLAGAAPRFATVRNPDRRTLGPEVGDDMRQLGAPPMPWQQYVLDVLYEVDEERAAAGAPHGFTGDEWLPLYYREGRVTVPRQSGKTTKAQARHVHRAKHSTRYGWGRRPTTIYTAQSASAARDKLINEWVPAIEDSPFLDDIEQVIKSNGRESIYWRGGGRLLITPPSRTGGHGVTNVDLVDVDEAFAHRDATVEQGVRPTMITRVCPQIVVTSTAGSAESEYLWGKVDDGRERCQTQRPGRVAYFEWSAPDGVDPADPAVWRACMPALGFTVTEEAIAAEFDAMDIDEFRRAYLNQWTSAVARIIPASAWAACHDPRSQIVGRMFLAVDASPGAASGRTASIAIAGYNADGRKHVEVIDHAPGLSWVADRVERLTRKWRTIERVYIDATGPIGSVLPDIEDKSAAPVETVSAQMMAAACQRLHEDVVTSPPTVVHIGQDVLDRAVEGAAKRQLLDSWAWARRTSTSDISPLVAVTLAHWGAVTNPGQHWGLL